MENTYIIKLVKPYHKNLRSELFKTPEIFFYDTGLTHMLWLKEIPKEIIGSIFETAIFSEIVKRYSKDSVLYWRTKDKKEIDFILRVKNEITPIEVKINFAKFNPSSINYFKQRYGIKEYKVVGLNGKTKNASQSYPWEI